MEKSNKGPIKTRLYYGPVWLQIGAARQLLVKVPHIEF
jgi:hypothetical protein